jgi:hypothetical protein
MPLNQPTNTDMFILYWKDDDEEGWAQADLTGTTAAEVRRYAVMCSIFPHDKSFACRNEGDDIFPANDRQQIIRGGEIFVLLKAPDLAMVTVHAKDQTNE